MKTLVVGDKVRVINPSKPGEWKVVRVDNYSVTVEQESYRLKKFISNVKKVGAMTFKAGDLVRISGFSDDSVLNGEHRITKVIGNDIFLENDAVLCACESCRQTIDIEKIGGENVVVNDEPVCVCKRLSIGHDPDCEWIKAKTP